METAVYIYLVCVLFAVIVFQGVFIYLQKRVYDETEKDLLNRLMSRNYETYVQAQELMKPPRQLTPEEIYNMQQERGIPV
jgi:hypothetical protein